MPNNRLARKKEAAADLPAELFTFVDPSGKGWVCTTNHSDGPRHPVERLVISVYSGGQQPFKPVRRDNADYVETRTVRQARITLCAHDSRYVPDEPVAGDSCCIHCEN